jgi:hypothetical protein
MFLKNRFLTTHMTLTAHLIPEIESILSRLKTTWGRTAPVTLRKSQRTGGRSGEDPK